MHEFALAHEIVRLVRDSLNADQLARVRRVNLTIGDLRAVQMDCLRFGFGIAAEGTTLAGAELVAEHVRPVFECKACQKTFEPTDPFFTPCPACGGYDTRIVRGDEFAVASVDIE